MMLDPNDPPETQLAKQSKIIQALMRRANRQKDVGASAFQAFQSAIELQQKLAEQSLDLERAADALESARYERERTRKSLVEALSSMEEGFALFVSGELDLCNEHFGRLLPELAPELAPGLQLERFFALLAGSDHFVSSDRALPRLADALKATGVAQAAMPVVIELTRDRWYQLSAQRTSSENVVVLLTEISEIVRRNRLEKEVLIDRQADYLQAVFQNMTSGVCTFSAEGEVMMRNARFRELLGLPVAILEPGVSLSRLLDHMRLRGVIGPEEERLLTDWRSELLRTGMLVKRVRPSGGDRVLDVQANRLPDGGFLVELKDVSLEARATETLENRVAERTTELTRANDKLVRQYEEKARVEEELRLAKEQAEAAVSSKTRFLAAASHDLLQPINAAKLLISTLRETTRDSRHAPMIERLDGAFRSAEQLLHALLDISRLESPDPDAVAPTDVSLASIMEGIYGDQVLVAEQKGVRLDMVPSSIFVHSDPVYLLRSIQNLIVNAIQYTPAGGRVLVGCRRRPGNRIVLEVWDTGEGIPLRDQERIFDEFTRSGAARPGTGMGLGLSVVDRACKLLGHRLFVRSAPGRGSVFGIEMDRVDGALPLPEPNAMLRSAPTEQLEHIVMVIENDEDERYGMTQWLEQQGASVLAARSTEEALQHVVDMGMAPDIILADYQLDNLDTGVAAISRIRAETGTHVPAVLITANRSESLRKAGIQNDVAVMTKPVRLSRLRALIDWEVRSGGRPEPAGVLRELTIPTKVDGDWSATTPNLAPRKDLG